MRYLFDTRSGQIRGKFETGYDFDGERSNGSFANEYIAFRFEETDALPALAVEGSQFYIDFANIALPNQLPLLDEGWVPFEEFKYFLLPQPDGEICDENQLFEVAEKTGPLFGVHDESAGHIKPAEIIEPLLCWFDAARILNLAVQAQAYLAGRANAQALDDKIYFILHTGHGENDFYWEAVSYYPEELSDPYSAMLEFCEDELARLFLPAKEKAFADMTIITHWDTDVLPWRSHPKLSVKLIPNGMAAEPIKPVAYTTFSYLASKPETEPVARTLVAHMVRALVLLHTRRVYHDLHDGFFGLAYNNLLERLWMSFAADAALGKLGVCEHCGNVFEAVTERKDRKIYCSKDCQEYAKSARNYRKRKIREAIAEECSEDVDYLLHVLGDPKITPEMVESVVKESAGK
jgi:hypothetical protein